MVSGNFTLNRWCTTPFFCMNSPRNRGWYQARVLPFSSGSGKGNSNSRIGCKIKIFIPPWENDSCSLNIKMFMSNIRLVAWSITKQSLFLSDDAHGPSCWRCALERIELRYQTNGQIITSWCKPIQLGASWFHARLDIPSGLYGARPCKTLIFTSASLGSSDCKSLKKGSQSHHASRDAAG